jgi:hypothetical protein
VTAKIAARKEGGKNHVKRLILVPVLPRRWRRPVRNDPALCEEWMQKNKEFQRKNYVKFMPSQKLK